MSIQSLQDSVAGVIKANIAFAEPAVFLMGFAEGVPVLSLLVPSSALFLGIGVAHAAAGGTFWVLCVSAAVGAMLSDCLVYLLARTYKADILGLPLFARNPEWWPRGHALIERWGVLGVAGGKFLGFLRPFVPAVAGVLEMPLWQFLPASAISSLLWAGTFLGAGHGARWIVA